MYCGEGRHGNGARNEDAFKVYTMKIVCVCGGGGGGGGLYTQGTYGMIIYSSSRQGSHRNSSSITTQHKID